MEKQKTKRHVSSNFLLMLGSIAISVIVWITLNMTAFPEMSTTIKNVPIDYTLDGTYADVAGLSIIGEAPETVNVKITGLRYDISDYTAADLKVTPNFDSVRTSGVYELSLNVASVDGDQITIDQTEPGTVHLEFDYFVRKTFSVAEGTLRADLSNVYAESGYIIDTEAVTVTPSEISISGPKDYVDSVTSCSIILNEGAGLTESFSTGNTSIKLHSGDAVYESDRITVESETVNVKIPVYIKKLLNLDIEVQSYSDRLDISNLTYNISPSSIIVRSQNSAIENISELLLGYIDLRQVAPGVDFSFEISDTSYYTNVSGVDTATVTFDMSGYSTKDITLPNSQIYVVNVPDGYRAIVETEKVRNITIVGPTDIIEQIDASDVIGQIDLLEYNVTNGSHILNITVYLPNYNAAWAVGTHKVYCHIEELPEEAVAPVNEPADTPAEQN